MPRENQHRLDGFLCGLLRIEAKILLISACYAALRYRQIASRTIHTTPADRREENAHADSYTTFPSCNAGLITSAWLSL